MTTMTTRLDAALRVPMAVASQPSVWIEALVKELSAMVTPEAMQAAAEQGVTQEQYWESLQRKEQQVVSLHGILN